ncbi:MAG: response regulator, partial [Candidatus Desulfofervidaceae bacterium]|nr:response regulator [Candidatus Desulfofervidaceae bacterium]
MNTATVLFVDDEVRILHTIKRMLRREDYNKLFASDGKEALGILEEESVQVLVTDLRMPEMDGLTLIKKVKEKYPEVVCIVLTAYSQIPTLLAAINQGHVYRYITKPWNSEEEFKQMIQEAIEYYNRQEEQKNLIQRLSLQNKILKNRVEKCEKKVESFSQQKKSLQEYFATNVEPLFKKLTSGKKPEEYLDVQQKIEEFKELLNKFS